MSLVWSIGNSIHKTNVARVEYVQGSWQEVGSVRQGLALSGMGRTMAPYFSNASNWIADHHPWSLS